MSKAENTRNFIVEKTAPIFNRKGYAGTSLTDLTEATGLTKGSIYGNFADKDEVALAAFDYNVAILTRGLSTAKAAANSSIGKLLKMTDYYRSEVKNSFARGGCPILNTSVEADDTHPRLKESVAKAIRAWKKSIESLIHQGKESKEINVSVDAGRFATEFMALIEGGTVLAKVTGNNSLLHTCIDRVEKIILTELAR